MKLYMDLHIHSCLSPCAQDDMTPQNICAMAALKGLDAIAITDHNATHHLPVVQIAAQKYGLILVPGLEITTREEVHVLSYFPTVDLAMTAGSFFFEHLPDMANVSKLFGRQVVVDESEEVLYEEERMLLGATDLSLDRVVEKTKQMGGIAVPAHINRGHNGILANLGFLPKDLFFPALEVDYHLPVPDHVCENKVILHASDAHCLGDILEPVFQMDVSQRSAVCILKSIGLS